MTELRQKMIRAMELRNLSNHTQRTYLAAVTGIGKPKRSTMISSNINLFL
jgi:hypothetical protein